MAKRLCELENQKVVEYLGLQDVDRAVLDRDGVELPLQVASNILEKLRELRFGDIRGHIRVNDFCNISYSENRQNCMLMYDYWQKTIQNSDFNINIAKADNIKVFVSRANWIDFFFDIDGVSITMTLVP